MFQNDKISISVSDINFSSKEETKTKTTSILFTPTSLDLNEITDYVNQGYALSHIFNPDFSERDFTMFEKKIENFTSAQFVTVDIDGIEEYDTLSSLLATISLIPSLAYTTLSHQTTTEEGIYKGNRYRLIYVFNQVINNVGQFNLLYDCIVNYLQTQISGLVCDSHMRNPVQMAFGSTSENRDNKEVYNNNVIYNIEDFLLFSPKAPSPTTKKKTKKEQIFEKFEVLDNVVYTIRHEEFMKDYDSKMPNLELLAKYKDVYELFDETPLPVVSDDVSYIMLPENYAKIRRFDELQKISNTNIYFKTGEKRKWKDGDGRKRKLYTNAVLRRYMIKDLEFDYLLYCLFWELSTYYINDVCDDYIRRDKLKEIAEKAYKVNVEGNNFKNWIKDNNDNSTFIVNEKYLIKHHEVTRQSVVNKAVKEINDAKIAKYYDINISVAKNKKILNENGVRVGLSKLYEFRDEYYLGKAPKPKKTKKEKMSEEEEDIIF